MVILYSPLFQAPCTPVSRWISAVSRVFTEGFDGCCASMVMDNTSISNASMYLIALILIKTKTHFATSCDTLRRKPCRHVRIPGNVQYDACRTLLRRHRRSRRKSGKDQRHVRFPGSSVGQQ